jgi:hypothetical protein
MTTASNSDGETVIGGNGEEGRGSNLELHVDFDSEESLMYAFCKKKR